MENRIRPKICVLGVPNWSLCFLVLSEDRACKYMYVYRSRHILIYKCTYTHTNTHTYMCIYIPAYIHIACLHYRNYEFTLTPTISIPPYRVLHCLSPFHNFMLLPQWEHWLATISIHLFIYSFTCSFIHQKLFQLEKKMIYLHSSLTLSSYFHSHRRYKKPLILSRSITYILLLNNIIVQYWIWNIYFIREETQNEVITFSHARYKY